MTFRAFTFLVVYTLLLFKLTNTYPLHWGVILAPFGIGFALELGMARFLQWMTRRKR